MTKRFGFEVRCVFHPDRSSVFRPLPLAWRVEVAHGRIGRARRLAKSFENTTASAAGHLAAACINLTAAELAA